MCRFVCCSLVISNGSLFCLMWRWNPSYFLRWSCCDLVTLAAICQRLADCWLTWLLCLTTSDRVIWSCLVGYCRDMLNNCVIGATYNLWMVSCITCELLHILFVNCFKYNILWTVLHMREAFGVEYVVWLIYLSEIYYCCYKFLNFAYCIFM